MQFVGYLVNALTPYVSNHENNTVRVDVRVVSSNTSHLLDIDLVVSEIHVLDLDGSSTSLTRPFVAFFVTLPFDSSMSARRFRFDIEATFQKSKPSLYRFRCVNS